MKRKYLVQASVVLPCLFMLSASTTLAQDLCDSYHDKYRVCVEAGEAGSNVDYDDCGTYTNDTDCINANCYWNDQGLPSPGTCVVDVCLADSDFSGRITGGDLTPLKRELGRMDCQTTPEVPAPALVPKTGQTLCYPYSGPPYDPIDCTDTGQDGEHQAGVEWPNPRFTDNGDGTVTDNLTGLMWTGDAQEISGIMDWNDTINGCNSLNYAGYDDWRLPNVNELLSLVDRSQINPALPSGHPFDNVQSDFYWSSTGYANDYRRVWYVHMGDGFVGADLKYVFGYYVWPVRGGND